MLTRALPLCVLLSVAGCSCGSDEGGVGDPCTLDADCGSNLRCIDDRCERAPDGGAASDDLGPGADLGARDSGPPRDFGPREDEDLGPLDAGTCGGDTIAIDFTPPNVLLVLDRSCSMRRLLDGSDFGTGPDDPGTRWNVAREAIDRLTSRYPGRVRWGLMAFPDARAGCGMPVTAEVAPAPMTTATITSTLRSSDIQPFGLCGPDNTDTTTQPRITPVGAALEATLAVPELMDTTRDNYAILIADGGENCGFSTADIGDAAAALNAAGIPTAAIGFSVGSSEGTLDTVGSMGGLPNPAGPPAFYAADDGAELDTALDAIVIPAIPCSFGLDSVPPDPDAIFVAANDTLLERDGADGYSYDETENRITLEGMACDDLRSGATTRIQVSFGCVPPECVPRDEVCNGLDEDCDDRVDEGCLI